MGFLSNAFISCGLSIDTFAFGLKPICSKPNHLKESFIVASFQTTLLFLGATIGKELTPYIEDWDHWIILIGLSYFGIKSIFEQDSNHDSPSTKWKFIGLCLLVSLDALAIGFSLITILPLGVYFLLILFLITFISFYAGGHLFKLGLSKFKHSKIIGGMVLILIGFKVFITHMMDHGL